MSAGPPDPPRLRALPSALPSDSELVARSLDEPEVFASLFDRHAVGVHRYLGRRVGERADDLLSETFLIAFRRRVSIVSDENADLSVHVGLQDAWRGYTADNMLDDVMGMGPVSTVTVNGRSAQLGFADDPELQDEPLWWLGGSSPTGRSSSCRHQRSSPRPMSSPWRPR